MKLTQKDFDEFKIFLEINFGINLTDKKKALVLGRLSKEFLTHDVQSLSEYLKIVKADKTGLQLEILLNKITTNHTYFYRENAHFEFLKDEVLPYLVDKKRAARDIRIWSAGCSIGAEAYSIAMLFHDTLGEIFDDWDTTILATDISTKVLESARKGIFEYELIKELPNMWRYNYFDKVDKSVYSVKENIKKEVIFRKHNLMGAFPFKKKFDVIFCRNVMIYFNEKTKVRLVNKFYDLLNDGGYLMIGHSETINKGKSKFKTIQPAIYRK